MRSPLAALTLLLTALPAFACSVCGASWKSKTTLREWFHQSKAVVSGTLKNPKPNPTGTGGTTEFHFATTLKSDPLVEKKASVVIPQYFPVVGNTAPDYLFFFDDLNGTPTVAYGVPGSAAVVNYLTAAAKLDPKDATALLAFYFRHLDDADPTVAADAFTEFAKAPDADILKAKGKFDPAKLAVLLADPKTPDDRLGVFAALLGLCGEAKHVPVFTTLLKDPLPERVGANLAGVMSGYVLLDPKGGWKQVRERLADPKAGFDRKLAPLSAVRFLQAGRGADIKAEVLDVYAGLIADPDLADLVIEDLRRWGWWDKTADVLGTWGKPAGEVREVKKAIVRYALTCPEKEAAAFLARVRKSDEALVDKVELSLKVQK